MMTHISSNPATARVFSAPYAPAAEELAAEFLATARLGDAQEKQIDATASTLISAIRARDSAFGGVEDLLHEYALSTPEGVALMMLAEALLRVPDDVTADRLIEDKIGRAGWAQHEFKSDSLLVTASAWALALAARIVGPRDTPRGILESLTHRLGAPAVRAATRRAVGIVGKHFVLGETIEDALSHAGESGAPHSFDMLGEGARTATDAQHYFQAYAHAIEAIGVSRQSSAGISVKLSALHPRYDALSRERVLNELTPRLLELARMAKNAGIDLTVDAEEADRLELSLDVLGAVIADGSLRGFQGLGLAVQAYQKRARAVIDHVASLATSHGARLKVRLVKGAYWDSEIKRAQERGLADYPVFTRKAMTDLSYMACMAQLLEARSSLWPQFATHNALTVASVLQHAGASRDFEFQRLHGMGEALYEKLAELRPDIACRVYAPVGSHRDLLAYLVRRLLENGANSSFVARVADLGVNIRALLQRPRDVLGDPGHARHPRIPLPVDLFGVRKNSRGVEFGCRAQLSALMQEICPWRAHRIEAAAIIDGRLMEGARRDCPSPIDGKSVGSVVEADIATIARATESAHRHSARWDATAVETRAAVLEHAADLIEERRGCFMALLQAEGGKTLDDALSEVREAVDYCRYYAQQSRLLFREHALPGPTGETNFLRHRGRGVFVCISPWNFPLAIFLGQIAAALVAGNAVVAKPAEQTPLIAFKTVRLLHEAGIPTGVLHLAPGGGDIGAALVAHARTAGVAFTGSTEVAWKINRALAAKDGPIVPFIAETGGINAMIADATALPEQVADDVVTSAFRSAGQRCSALRLLCLQEDVADRVIAMVEGAVRELKAGDPRDPSVHIGPVIDAEARDALAGYLAELKPPARILWRGAAPRGGTFFPPHIVELERAGDLRREVFGPILHVVRWRADETDEGEQAGLVELLEELEGSGFGLTLGIHTRIYRTAELIAGRLKTGNVYINRSMIGAVVGSQPFGGNGLSGTGPKAGGPGYLPRFALEQTVSTNVAAAGGNVSLIAASEDVAGGR